MSDPDVIALLTEIRDLHRQHIEEYRSYLARYEKLSAEHTAKVTRGMRVVLLIMLLLGGLLGAMVLYVVQQLAQCPAWG